MRRPSRRMWIAAALLVALALCGCAHTGAAAPESGNADVGSPNAEGVATVTLTQDAMRSIGIRTRPVGTMSAPAGADPASATPSAGTTVSAGLVIPITALIYDPRGKAWTYTQIGPRTFIRAPLVIDRIVGDTVYLRSGPPLGTPVVTVGAAELLGTEYGVGGEG